MKYIVCTLFLLFATDAQALTWKQYNTMNNNNKQEDEAPAYQAPQLCPDGTYIASGTCTLCPDGTYVANRCVLTPNGTYVGR